MVEPASLDSGILSSCDFLSLMEFEMNAEWKLLNVDTHRLDNPDFFAYPAISLDQRESIQLGEQAKILLSLKRVDDWKTKGVWVVVERVVGANRFVGRPFSGYSLHFPPNQDRLIEFGPDHVYRMPPREFTIWGRDGKPQIVWGNSQSDSQPQTPDGEAIPDLEPILTVEANGWTKMKSKYASMAPEQGWPSYDELPKSRGVGFI